MEIEEAIMQQQLITLADKLIRELSLPENTRIGLINNLIETSSFYLWLEKNEPSLPERDLTLPLLKKKLRRFIDGAKKFVACLKYIEISDIDTKDSYEAGLANAANIVACSTIENAYHLLSDQKKESTLGTSCLEDVQIKLNHSITCVEFMLKIFKNSGSGAKKKSIYLEEIIQRLVYAYKIASGEEKPKVSYCDFNEGYKGDLYFFINECIEVIVKDFSKNRIELGSIIKKILNFPIVLVLGDEELKSACFYGFKQFNCLLSP